MNGTDRVDRCQASFRAWSPLEMCPMSDPAANLSIERPRKIIHIDMDAFYASVEQRGRSFAVVPSQSAVFRGTRRGGGRQLRGA